MKNIVQENFPGGFSRRRCLGLMLLASIVVIVLLVQLTDQSLQVNVVKLSNSSKLQHSLMETVHGSTPKTGLSSLNDASTTSTTSTTTTATKSPDAGAVVTHVVSTNEDHTNKTIDKPQEHPNDTESQSVTEPPTLNKNEQPNTDTGVKNVKNKSERTIFPSDFIDESDLEPFCAMQSNAFKYLIWPDTPTDLTDWTYKRIRKCPKFVIPENITFTKRVKYSLNCDNGKPKLLPSFTDRSDDIDVVTLTDSCLARFTNSCCNDTRGTPNIVHYVWYFNNEMKFSMFLSMLSIVRYVRPCLILFHGEYLPYGKYWDYIIRIYPNVLHVKRSRPLFIFERKISHHEHSGDIMRMDALMQLGGIYFDTDVIVLRDLEPLRVHDITLCRQASGYLLNAFIMSKKNTTFMNLWMDGYRKDYQNDSYVFNSMWYNNDLAYNRTDLIHVEEGTLCAPAILIGKPYNATEIYDWTMLYGFHLYSRIIHYPWDVDWIKSFNTTLGSMVRQVVYGNKELCV